MQLNSISENFEHETRVNSTHLISEIFRAEIAQLNQSINGDNNAMIVPSKNACILTMNPIPEMDTIRLLQNELINSFPQPSPELSYIINLPDDENLRTGLLALEKEICQEILNQMKYVLDNYTNKTGITHLYLAEKIFGQEKIFLSCRVDAIDQKALGNNALDLGELAIVPEWPLHLRPQQQGEQQQRQQQEQRGHRR